MVMVYRLTNFLLTVIHCVYRHRPHLGSSHSVDITLKRAVPAANVRPPLAAAGQQPVPAAAKDRAVFGRTAIDNGPGG